ncbi:fungal-specific transcription factor domain-containing protein [Aspergillus karnatakaensis]|uniref:transcription factor domain-containing protein n=1 Tax=Aspergillus karnatakaensis TaxID=1810916 RepID=UPI003CCDBB3A
MPLNGVQKNTRPSSRTCKTCTPCRKKKIKCDGVRPQCVECTTNGLVCVFPQDARREPRPSRTRVQTLEMTVLALVEHMRAAGIVPPQTVLGESMPDGNGSVNVDGEADDTMVAAEDSDVQNMRSENSELAGCTATAPAVANRQLPTPSTSGSTADKHDFQPIFDLSLADLDGRQLGQSDDPASHAPHKNQNDNNETVSAEGSGMSPCEARVAGAYHDQGCVSSVHGLASIMNPTLRAQHKANISTMVREGENAIAASKARLISNAALQRQREPRIFRDLSNSVDLDGCEPELARHLLDVHFNRQHYAYLLSYRPAIMEGIANGGGPWVNKLLLNAIYFSGTLYSDRPTLRGTDLNDENSMTAQFYRRFRQVLSDEIIKPSIPSAVALLLMSASLVSKGQSSAGWNLSGIAYRMIMDKGCHLMLGPDYQQKSTPSSGRKHSQLLRRDLEQEMRKRLYWGAFVTDATQSLYLGRPCMFATSEARVPLLLLDTFEEFEDWEPYADPYPGVNPPPAYSPQPAHAVSTFNALVRLFQISTRITELYGIQIMKCTSAYLLETKAAIERDLENWHTSLPDHLQFDPEGTSTPPPHQITPHTTFHALLILLHRAFLEEGHLRRHSNSSTRALSEQACITSALAIQKLVKAYKTAFTLRRAPFLLSYAVYCAVNVILRQERHDRGHFIEVISFFWTCLGELQGGCNFGLEKPLGILRDMVSEFQVSTRGSETGGVGGPQGMGYLGRLDEEIFPLPGGESPPFQDFIGMGMGMPDLGLDGVGSPGFLASLNQLENDLSHDSLYGLFAPSQLH